ncbi:cytoskeletal-regulatory complex EF hand-domain-containing protein [Kickxella alabastrina]|uniref:cytoskeletal-regulatory complex EF hand-domain-containing protein n=1 Tax=Kickxella alabastrina TaxID=61397 RepID=UPI00221E506F|nr:cytoskeletal-regulatory complex EF hand-domain-containing protein [Kickxella alabastrina]KAI7834156.1 cytoskeletal-regulatory complex EF hand-domain-containing protein [Kickxella alabastrina]
MNSGLAISHDEKQQFQQHFLNANPVDGRLPGAVARQSLMQSGLPTQQLGQIWELADIDKDGALDFDEYCIALKLVFSLLNKVIPSIPPSLPPTLIPQSKYAYFAGSMANAQPQQPQWQQQQTQQQQQPQLLQQESAKLEWYVPGEDRARYQGLFAQHSRGSAQVRLLDIDEFLNSLGTPRSGITQAWSLLDVRKYQQLNQEQFIYLLHVLNAHMRGAPIPATLPPAVKDNLYKSLNLDSSGAAGSPEQSYGYRHNKSSAPVADSRKPGLYGEKSGNVALADSYLSKLKTSSTFKNEAGSRYASSSKNAEEEKKLRAELKGLEEEFERIKTQVGHDDQGSRDGDLIEATVKELQEFKEYKLQEKRRLETQSVGSSGSNESLQAIKESLYSLEGHLSFLMSEKRAIDEFISAGKQELLELQVEQIKLK